VPVTLFFFFLHLRTVVVTGKDWA